MFIWFLYKTPTFPRRDSPTHRRRFRFSQSDRMGLTTGICLNSVTTILTTNWRKRIDASTHRYQEGVDCWIGSHCIGQACEFDYSGTQACKALRGLGYEIVLVNSNPATIMTDPVMADTTFIEPVSVEVLKEIIAETRPDALLPNLGGQTGLNLSSELYRKG